MTSDQESVVSVKETNDNSSITRFRETPPDSEHPKQQEKRAVNNDQIDEIQNQRRTIEMIKGFKADKTTDTAEVKGLLNSKSLTFYDSILENAFSITMFVRRGHDIKFAIAIVFIIHIIFASFYGQIKDSMIATVISWSISAALFIASIVIKMPDFVLESIQESEEKNTEIDDEIAGVSKDKENDENVDQNISVLISHSTLYSLILLNFVIYFLGVRIFYDSVTYAQLGIIFLFQLQFVRTFGYLRFIHFVAMCMASIAVFLILKTIDYVSIESHFDFGKEFAGDAILCFLVVIVSVCLTGKYLYHYEYDERASFHTYATADDNENGGNMNLDLTKNSTRKKTKKAVNRGLAGLVLDDVGREILDHHFDTHFDHQFDDIVLHNEFSVSRNHIHIHHPMQNSFQSHQENPRTVKSHFLYHSNELNLSVPFIENSSAPQSGMSTPAIQIPILRRKHSHNTVPTTALALPARESTMEHVLRGFVNGLSHGTRIRRPPLKQQPIAENKQIGASMATFYNLGQHGTDTERMLSCIADDEKYDSKQHQTVNQRLGKEEKDDKEKKIIIEEYIEPDLYSLYDLPEWYSPYEFVLHGYRLGYSFKEHATKVGICNWKQNEWCNTVTSIVPGIIVLLVWIFYIVQFPNFFINQPLSSKLVVIFPMNYGIVSSAASTFSHNFHTVSEKYVRKVWNVDFCGIIYFCVGISVMQIHCMFYCQQEMQIMFIFMVFLLTVVSVITSVKTLDDSIRESVLGLLLVMAFVLMPIAHWIQLAIGDTTSPAVYSIGMGFCIFFLAAMIVFKTFAFPEKYFVTKFLKKKHGVNILETLMSDEEYFGMMREASEEMKDHWSFYYFNSHSIWHILSCFTGMVMFLATAEYLKYRGSREC